MKWVHACFLMGLFKNKHYVISIINNKYFLIALTNNNQMCMKMPEEIEYQKRNITSLGRQKTQRKI